MPDNHSRKYRKYYINNLDRRKEQQSRSAILSLVRPRFVIAIIIIVAMLCLITWAIVFKLPYKDGHLSSLSLTENKQIEAPKPLPPPINEQLLKTQIETIISANPQLDIGVSVQDLAVKAPYTYGVDQPFIAASVGKLLTATLYLKQVESGNRSLDQVLDGQTARVQIQKMIANSDNPAWTALNGNLTHPALEDYAKSIGINSYSAETNVIKPSEVSNFLAMLYQKQLLNEDDTSFLLANMRQDQEELQFIRKYISPDISVYHKAGWLSDRAHDTAIVENGDRPYVLVIFTKARYGDYDFQRGQQIFSQITNTVQTAFTL